MITVTSLKHPVMQERILNAVIEAQESVNAGRGRAYIANSKGDNIMRLDVFGPGVYPHMPDGGVVVYGRESKVITNVVETALGQKFCDLI